MTPPVIPTTDVMLLETESGAAAEDVTEAQSAVVDSSSVVAVEAVVDGRVVEASGHESTCSSVYQYIIIVDHEQLQEKFLPNTTRNVICGS